MAAAAPAESSSYVASTASTASTHSREEPFLHILRQVNPTTGEVEELARIFLPKSAVEEDSDLVNQLTAMGKLGLYDQICVMPDAHAGGSCSVGVAASLLPYRTLEDGTVQRERVVPAHIGGDIGCGMLTYPLGVPEKLKREKLDKEVRELLPLSQGSFSEPLHARSIVTNGELERMCNEAREEAIAFAQAYQERYNLDISANIPDYSPRWFKEQCKVRWKVNYDNIERAMGTLGSGNHFVELNKNKETGMHYLSIHSGSRNLGQHVMSFHQGIITRGKTIDLVGFDREKRRLKKLHKGNKQLLEKLVADAEVALTKSTHPPYLEGAEAYAYYFDMIFTQKYASMNREIMLTRILQRLGFRIPHLEISPEPEVDGLQGVQDFDPSQCIETIHNYIDFHDFVLRKGAIAAPKDKLCIVALNMCDGILLCRGKGNKEWNQSCSHGAGRLLKRKEALRSVEFEAFAKHMEKHDVYSTCIVPEILDEAHLAYKDPEMIKRAIGDTVEIVAQLHTIWNIKSWVKRK